MALRIALLTYSTKPRGSVIHALELATALTRLGHQVCLYALCKPGSSGFERPLPCAVQLIPAQPAPDDIDGLIRQRIAEFVAALRPTAGQYDVYHAQDCIGANALGQLRNQGCRPIVRTVHHVEAFESIYLQQCQDRSIREPDLCLAVSHRWQQTLARDYGIDAVRVVNGVDQRRFNPQPNGEDGMRKRYGLAGPVLLTIGGIEPRKNSIRLLQAFAQVRRAHPTAQLVIVGGATLFDYQPYRDKFFAEVDTLGLNEALVLPGVLSDASLPAFYRCADALVFPSLKEGWGLVVLEAIASGVPVVTSNQPPFTEFLSPHQACLADPLDVNAIAVAIEQALDPQVAQNVVDNSQAVLSHYSWDRSAAQHGRAYQSLCANFAAPASPR